jgi:hypothetical protein
LETGELSNFCIAFMNPERLLHVLKDMRRFGTLVFAFVALAAGPGSARGFLGPDTNAAPLTQHQMDLRYGGQQPQPYSLNYSDEAARNLGIENGKWEAFSTHSSDPLMPRFKGGIENGKAMVGLQWRFGS